MKKIIIAISIAIAGITTMVSCKNQNISEEVTFNKSEEVAKRVGMVVKLKADKVEEYKKLHAEDHPGVRDLLIKYNLRNFSIYLHKLEDGNYYEFGYYEYVGNNFEEDMAKLAEEPRNKEWIKVCAPMQTPLEGYTEWAKMEQIYFNY